MWSDRITDVYPNRRLGIEIALYKMVFEGFFRILMPEVKNGF